MSEKFLNPKPMTDIPYRSEILSNKQQKTVDLSSAKSSSSSLLTANEAQKIYLISQMNTKIEAIKLATQSTKNNTEIIASERHTSGSSLSTENNSISTSATAEENTKAVNKIYLRVIVQQQPITSTDLSTLSSIGHQCPFIGGPGVYDA